MAARGVKTRSKALSFAVNYPNKSSSMADLDEMNNWMSGHTNLSDEELVSKMMSRFGITKYRAEELVGRHRRVENFGWRGNYAAKKLNGKKVAETEQGIPITIKDKEKSDRKYPISPKDAKKTFDSLPPEMVEGITEVNFREPGIPATKQDKAWAQYVRSKQRVNIFSQPYKSGKFQEVDRGLENKSEAKRYMMSYVVPHETAHHYLQHNLGMNNDPEIIEEARADALAYGDNPFDSKVVEKYIGDRQDKFGIKGTI